MAPSREPETSVLRGAQAASLNDCTPGQISYSLFEPKSNEDIAPCLSVVMPVFNEEPTVDRIVRSVLEQRPVQELIIVDDCSTDKTWQVLKGVTDPRLKLFRL